MEVWDWIEESAAWADTETVLEEDTVVDSAESAVMAMVLVEVRQQLSKNV